ncbi:MAG TPA: hypothetical protein VIK91_23290 [Nannocystis sp.]
MTAQKVDVVVEPGRVRIVQSPGAIVPAGSESLAPAAAVPWTGLLGSALTCVGLGVLLLGMFPHSLLGLMLCSAGTGLGVVAMVRRAKGANSRPPPALPAATIDPALLAERCRRVRAILRDGPLTFEAIKSALKWTQAALVSTLVHMKEQGEVIEDLSLDTGEWVYTLAEGPAALAGSPSLAERQAQASAAEGQG